MNLQCCAMVRTNCIEAWCQFNPVTEKQRSRAEEDLENGRKDNSEIF